MLTRTKIKLPTLLEAIPEIVGEGKLVDVVQSQARTINALRKEHYEFMRAVTGWAEGLNKPGALTLAQAAIYASNIQFPATQIASSDPNALDDYEEATNWLPVLSFATVGDSAWAAPTVQVGDATKIGREVRASFRYTGVVTHTTAAGNLQLTGLPYTPATDTNFLWDAACAFSGINKAGYSQITAAAVQANGTVLFSASGMGVALANVTFADVPTGGTVIVRATLAYRV